MSQVIDGQDPASRKPFQWGSLTLCDPWLGPKGPVKCRLLCIAGPETWLVFWFWLCFVSFLSLSTAAAGVSRMLTLLRGFHNIAPVSWSVNIPGAGICQAPTTSLEHDGPGRRSSWKIAVLGRRWSSEHGGPRRPRSLEDYDPGVCGPGVWRPPQTGDSRRPVPRE